MLNNLFAGVNDIKYVDLEVGGLGFLNMEMEDFEYFIKDITESGYTYRFVVAHNGNTLTKDGVPFDSILFTVHDNELFLEKSEDLSPKSSVKKDGIIKDLSSFIGTEGNRFSEDEVENVLKSAGVMLADSFMFLELQSSLEKMIRGSDHLKNIYINKGITPEDVFKDSSLWFDLENMSLAYFKTTV